MSNREDRASLPLELRNQMAERRSLPSAWRSPDEPQAAAHTSRYCFPLFCIEPRQVHGVNGLGSRVCASQPIEQDFCRTCMQTQASDARELIAQGFEQVREIRSKVAARHLV